MEISNNLNYKLKVSIKTEYKKVYNGRCIVAIKMFTMDIFHWKKILLLPFIDRTEKKYL